MPFLLSSLITPSENLFGRGVRCMLLRLPDFRKRALSLVSLAIFVRYQARDRLAVARDHDRLAALDVIEQPEQLRLRDGYGNGFHVTSALRRATPEFPRA